MSHHGALSFDDIGLLLTQMRQQLAARDVSASVQRCVYIAMVELLENVYHHQADGQCTEGYCPEFCLMLDERQVYLCTSNTVQASLVDQIRRRIDHVNELDAAGLKAIYRDRLLHGVVSEKGGAGLGIVNVARVMSSRMRYDFRPINGEYAYFTLNTTIERN